MAVSSRPISARPISGDIDDPAAQQGVFKRRFRTPVVQDRYPDFAEEGMADVVAPEPAKSPIYDSLSPEGRAKVDRFIIGHRLAQRGVA